MTWQLMMLTTAVVCIGVAYWADKKARDFSFTAFILGIIGACCAFVVWFDTLVQLPDFYKPSTTIESQMGESKRKENAKTQNG